MTEDDMVGSITDSVNMSLSTPRGDGEGQGGLLCAVSPWGRKESDTIE